MDWLPHRSRFAFRWAEWGPSLRGVARCCALLEHAVQKGSCPRRVTRLEPRGVPAVQKGLVSRDQYVTGRRGGSSGAWEAVSHGGWLHPAVDRRGYGNDASRGAGLLCEPPMPDCPPRGGTNVRSRLPIRTIPREQSPAAEESEPSAESSEADRYATDASWKAVQKLIPVAEESGVVIGLENVWNNLWVLSRRLGHTLRSSTEETTRPSRASSMASNVAENSRFPGASTISISIAEYARKISDSASRVGCQKRTGPVYAQHPTARSGKLDLVPLSHCPLFRTQVLRIVEPTRSGSSS